MSNRLTKIVMARNVDLDTHSKPKVWMLCGRRKKVVKSSVVVAKDVTQSIEE